MIIGHIVIAKDTALLGLRIPKKKGEELTLSREGKRILPEMRMGKRNILFNQIKDSVSTKNNGGYKKTVV